MATAQKHFVHDLGPFHPPKVEGEAIKPSTARHINIRVKDPLDHEAPAIIHEPHRYNASQTNRAAVVMVSGAGGGVSGPAGIYPSLADKLALLISVPTIRLDYREPAKTDICASDIIAAFNYLSYTYSSTNFVLVGWSFGGSPCFAVAAQEPERVRGVATIASQTINTSGIKELNPRPLLLLHGEDDLVLTSACSETLYRQYGAGGEKELRLFEGDDHGLSRNAPEAERMLLVFITKALGLEELLDPGTVEMAGKDLVESREERVREMEKGHDLEGGESLNYDY